ncbi:MAG: hypothetical protein ABJH68_14760 [Ilumatobacter sp.]|uniref:hypothetical protein n=1 Tax=Ilumatobacter sp. TaxID=1967498 RepID=UPI00329A7969
MSKATNLRPGAGGNPAWSNSTGSKNDPKARQRRNDFPDSPDSDVDATPQDKPDLDAFAKRIGTDTVETGDGLDAVPSDRSPESDEPNRRLIGAGVGAAVAAFVAIAVLRRRNR